MSNHLIPEAPNGEFILFNSADGSTKVECRFESDSLWLTQALIAELYQKGVPTINEHLSNIYSDGTLSCIEFCTSATSILSSLIVQPVWVIKLICISI